MFVVDTNILVYAADERSAPHRACLAKLEEWRRLNSPWYLTWSIAYEFLRVTTHSKVFRRPWPASRGWKFIEALRSSPGFEFLVEGENHADALATLVHEFPDVSGNLLHDAHTAALMKEHGVRTIWTRDADFHRFPFLEVRDPLR